MKQAKYKINGTATTAIEKSNPIRPVKKEGKRQVPVLNKTC